MDIIENLTWRSLRNLSTYRQIESGSFPDCVPSAPPLGSDERCIGVYEQAAGQTEHSVLVTNLGLHVRRKEGWEFMSYRDIALIDSLPPEKTNFRRLNVHLINGRTAEIPVEGGHGKLRDAFIFLHFLDRVRDYLERSAGVRGRQ